MLPSERVWVTALDVAAWGLLETQDAERAENEERAAKGLPPLPKLKQPKGATKDTVQISVGGVKRDVPLPPPGCFYGPDGQLIRPDAMRF